MLFIINKSILIVFNKQQLRIIYAANPSLKSFKSSNKWFEFCIIGVTEVVFTQATFFIFSMFVRVSGGLAF